MKRLWTIIGVGGVARSGSWYQTLFGHTRTQEFSLRDPDGYYVTISSLV
jgi:hypothetical protein